MFLIDDVLIANNDRAILQLNARIHRRAISWRFLLPLVCVLPRDRYNESKSNCQSKATRRRHLIVVVFVLAPIIGAEATRN